MKVEIFSLLSNSMKVYQDLNSFDEIVILCNNLKNNDDLELFAENVKLTVSCFPNGFMVACSAINSEEDGLLLDGEAANMETALEILRFFFFYKQLHPGYKWIKVDPEDELQPSKELFS